jgi:hypothetical protein
MGQDSDGAAAAGGAGIQSSGISGSGASDHTTGNFNELLTRAASKLSVEARRAQCTLAARKSKGRKQEVYPGPVTGGPLRPPSRAECHQWGRARAFKLAPAAFISPISFFGGRAHWQPEAICARPAAPFKLGTADDQDGHFY